MNAEFILSKKILLDQVKKLEEVGLKICYSYKTNKIVGDVLQEISNVDFSIHAFEEISRIKDKSKIWFFTQAESNEELGGFLNLGIRNFVVDNEIDLKRILEVLEEKKIAINLSLRMKFQEHRVGSGKYFVYGMNALKVNKLILNLKENDFVKKIGVHLHRKSQNVSEWEIVEELKDSLDEETLEEISFVNLGGGLPSVYRSSNVEVFDYIFKKLKDAKEWLLEKNIETFIEPGRFLAAPCVRLIVEVIQKYDKNLIINTSIYNCALDTVLTGTKMLVEGELEQGGQTYLIKGNSPTRDDIFRYAVKLNKVEVGEKIVFLNAGAYNYTTDFFGDKKLMTRVVENFKYGGRGF